MNKEYIYKKSSSLSVNVAASKVESLRKVVETTSTVRVYDNGFIGVAGQVGDCEMKKLEAEAIKNLENKIPYPCVPSPVIVRSENTIKNIVDTDNFIDVSKRLLARLEKETPDFLFNNKIQYYEDEVNYINDSGSNLSYKGNEFVIALSIKHKSTANLMDLTYISETNDYDEDKAVQDVKKLYDAFNTPASIENGKYKVIASPAVFVETALGNFMAHMYASGATVFKDGLNKKILSDKLSIYADYTDDAINVPFFDDEGDVAENGKSYLIENGVLIALFANKNAAALYNVPRVASSSASYDGVPSTGFGSLRFEETATDVKELIGDDAAVFVMMVGGGDTTSSGDYACPVHLAFLVKNGEIVGKLPPLSVTGNIKDYLNGGYVGTAEKGFLNRRGQLSVCEMDVTNI